MDAVKNLVIRVVVTAGTVAGIYFVMLDESGRRKIVDSVKRGSEAAGFAFGKVKGLIDEHSVRGEEGVENRARTASQWEAIGF